MVFDRIPTFRLQNTTSVTLGIFSQSDKKTLSAAHTWAQAEGKEEHASMEGGGCYCTRQPCWKTSKKKHIIIYICTWSSGHSTFFFFLDPASQDLRSQLSPPHPDCSNPLTPLLESALPTKHWPRALHAQGSGFVRKPSLNTWLTQPVCLSPSQPTTLGLDLCFSKCFCASRERLAG